MFAIYKMHKSKSKNTRITNLGILLCLTQTPRPQLARPDVPSSDARRVLSERCLNPSARSASVASNSSDDTLFSKTAVATNLFPTSASSNPDETLPALPEYQDFAVSILFHPKIFYAPQISFYAPSFPTILMSFTFHNVLFFHSHQCAFAYGLRQVCVSLHCVSFK